MSKFTQNKLTLAQSEEILAVAPEGTTHVFHFAQENGLPDFDTFLFLRQTDNYFGEIWNDEEWEDCDRFDSSEFPWHIVHIRSIHDIRDNVELMKALTTLRDSKAAEIIKGYNDAPMDAEWDGDHPIMQLALRHDELLRQVRELEDQQQSLAERDALAAHVDMLLRTGNKLESITGGSIEINLARADWREVESRQPQTSLAEHDAEVARELAVMVRQDYGHHTQYSVSLLCAGIDGYADSFEKDAERVKGTSCNQQTH